MKSFKKKTNALPLVVGRILINIFRGGHSPIGANVEHWFKRFLRIQRISVVGVCQDDHEFEIIRQ